MRRCVNSLACLAVLSGYALTLVVDLPSVSAATVFTEHHRIPNEKKDRAIEVLLDYLRQTSDEQCFSGFPDMEQRTKIVTNHRVAFRTVTSTPKVVLVDLSLGYSPYSDLHLIVWEMNTSYKRVKRNPRWRRSIYGGVTTKQETAVDCILMQGWTEN